MAFKWPHTLTRDIIMCDRMLCPKGTFYVLCVIYRYLCTIICSLQCSCCRCMQVWGLGMYLKQFRNTPIWTKREWTIRLAQNWMTYVPGQLYLCPWTIVIMSLEVLPYDE